MSPGVLKKKLFITLTKDNKEDYSRRTNAMQLWRELDPNSRYNKNKWRFIAKELDRGQWVENY